MEPDYEYTVRIKNSIGIQSCIHLYLFEDGKLDDTGKVSIRYVVDDTEEFIQDDDFFDCFTQIRMKYEENGYLFLCFGSSLGFFPSPVLQEQSLGMQLYKLNIGKKTSISDIVNIFDFDETVSPCDFQCQLAFYQKWLESLR